MEGTVRRHVRMRQGAAMRSKIASTAMRRKEEYLGARVPKMLKEKVIAQAEERGIPVSILIRNVLEEAFGKDSSQPGAADRNGINGQGSGGEKRVAKRYPGILGWEFIRLNQRMACTECGTGLEPGCAAMLGIGTSLATDERILLCDLCKESI